MAAKIVKQVESFTRMAKVTRLSVTGEYVVKFFDLTQPEGKRYLPDADYYTDDKADAIGTANHWIKGV